MLCWKTFDPYPVVEVNPASPRLGEVLKVKWNFCGPIWRLRSLTVWLEGREETTVEAKAPGELVSHPTEKTLSEAFFCQRLAAPVDLASCVCGAAALEVPRARVMPSFEAEKTTIKWVVRFEGRIAWSPRMKHEFGVTMLAGEVSSPTLADSRAHDARTIETPC